DQIRASECHRNDRLARVVQLLGQRGLLFRNVNVAFSVADTDKECEDRYVVRIERGQFQIRGAAEARVGSEGDDGIEAPAQFALEVFARHRFRVSIESDKQSARRLCSVPRQAMRSVAQQSDSAVGYLLSLNLQRGFAEF